VSFLCNEEQRIVRLLRIIKPSSVLCALRAIFLLAEHAFVVFESRLFQLKVLRSVSEPGYARQEDGIPLTDWSLEERILENSICSRKFLLGSGVDTDSGKLPYFVQRAFEREGSHWMPNENRLLRQFSMNPNCVTPIWQLTQLWIHWKLSRSRFSLGIQWRLLVQKLVEQNMAVAESVSTPLPKGISCYKWSFLKSVLQWSIAQGIPSSCRA